MTSTSGGPGATALWGIWQRYGAQGLSGAAALAAELDRIVRSGGIASPPTTRRGLAARLNYLSSPAGREALAEHGVSRRLLRSWERGTHPSPAKAEAVDRAYTERRTVNLLRSGALKKRLDNAGYGTRMEVHPVDQSAVPEQYRRPNLHVRSIQVRYVWDDVVTAWAAGDLAELDRVWEDIIQDLDSDYAAYAYVGSIGLGA